MSNKEKFEAWFQQQSFYLNLRFIHGDRLFASENSVYRILAVQIGWEAWQEQQVRIDGLQYRTTDVKKIHEIRDISETTQERWVEKYARRSHPSNLRTEPQACDHTMVEKSQLGDLERTFECIFCDHKTTEAWVTTHE